jgi:hypothetical protein
MSAVVWSSVINTTTFARSPDAYARPGAAERPANTTTPRSAAPMASDANNECFLFTRHTTPALGGAIERERRSHEPRSRSERQRRRVPPEEAA